MFAYYLVIIIVKLSELILEIKKLTLRGLKVSPIYTVNENAQPKTLNSHVNVQRFVSSNKSFLKTGRNKEEITKQEKRICCLFNR